jgi:GH25 family lysozyme M1 (1,4-beta-N-acetylmuramidase)
MYKGIDVSHYQGKMLWNIAKSAGISFAILKAGEGTSFKDDQFEYNVSECNRLGIPWGAYFYWYPQYDPIAQANNFINILAGRVPKMLAWGDFEQPTTLTATQVQPKVKAFMERMDDSYKVGIYTSPYYWESKVGSPLFGANYPLWIANYQVSSPKIPAPWTKALIWQYSSSESGSKYGAQSATVDTDYWMGTDEEFAKLIGSSPVVVTPPATTPGATVLFKAICIRPEGVDTRDANGVDIKQDLHFEDIVNVYEISADGKMYKIDPSIQRWVTSSTNYMLKLLPPTVKDVFSDEEKAALRSIKAAHPELKID